MRWMKTPEDGVPTFEVAIEAVYRQGSPRSGGRGRQCKLALKLGCGGSLLRDLWLLQRIQKLKADATVLAEDGAQLSGAASQLEH